MRFAKTLLIVFAGFMANYIVFETAAIQYGLANGVTLVWFAGIFIVSDFITVPLPYLFSNYLIRRLPRFRNWLDKKVRPNIANLEKLTGGWSEMTGFAVISYFTSTWLASFAAAIMLVDLRHAFIGIVAGDLIYFAALYGSIAGTEALLPESRWKFIIVLAAVVIIVTIIQKIVRLWLNALNDKNNGGP